MRDPTHPFLVGNKRAALKIFYFLKKRRKMCRNRRQAASGRFFIESRSSQELCLPLDCHLETDLRIVRDRYKDTPGKIGNSGNVQTNTSLATLRNTARIEDLQYASVPRFYRKVNDKKNIHARCQDRRVAISL